MYMYMIKPINHNFLGCKQPFNITQALMLKMKVKECILMYTYTYVHVHVKLRMHVYINSVHCMYMVHVTLYMCMLHIHRASISEKAIFSFTQPQ